MSVVELAIECVKAVEKIGGQFRSRARRFHTDIYVLGPAYVVALAAARSSKDKVSMGLNAETCEKAMSQIISGEGDSVEKKSYAAYGAALLYILKKLGAVRESDFATVLKKLNDDPPYEALEVANWLKLLAEAYFAERE
ncbi:MAG: type III-B CRISPR module-associated protein Cmr5 [Desulfurococcaceae archaeon]